MLVWVLQSNSTISVCLLLLLYIHVCIERFVLWLNIYFVLENVLCTLEKNTYAAVVGWSVL